MTSGAPSFLQPAFDPTRRRPSHDHLPSGGAHMDRDRSDTPDGCMIPTTPSGRRPMPPSTPSSGRPTSGRRGYTGRNPRPPTSGGGTPDSLNGTSHSLNSTGSMAAPGTAGRVSTDASTAPSSRCSMGGFDMEGFVPEEEQEELLKVNAALRERNKELHQQLGRLKVEHEMLRMNESFLCDEMSRMGLEPLTCA